MAKELAKKFIDALHKLEADHDLETIVGLFDENAKVGNVVTTEKNLGAREFWQSYRDSFKEIASTFRNEIVTDKIAALEWTSKGTSTDGKEFEYDGVSILEINGDKISRFHAYFDPNNLGHQIVDEKSREANG